MLTMQQQHTKASPFRGELDVCKSRGDGARAGGCRKEREEATRARGNPGEQSKSEGRDSSDQQASGEGVLPLRWNRSYPQQLQVSECHLQKVPEEGTHSQSMQEWQSSRGK